MEEKFVLHSPFAPSGDQPEAIKALVDGIDEKKEHQVLLGVTGSGKTFTIANVIAQLNRPSLIISHNKTLASQLYSELKALFPDNRVEYFVSYFDFYKPEAYIPKSDLYIEKTSKNNKELEAMRMSAINALSIRKDTIVVASVAAIYGESNPKHYRQNFFPIEVGMQIDRKSLLLKLSQIGYERNRMELNKGQFDVKGDSIEICPGYVSDTNIRIDMFGNEIEAITLIDPLSKNVEGSRKNMTLFPATTYTVHENTIQNTVDLIKQELSERIEYFKSHDKLLEAQRIKDRTLNDLDSLLEFGYTSGIENYSRYLDGRAPGQRPYTLFDYLPDDSVIFIDESHLMIPQLHGMHNGDRARKLSLVEYGFRLPSALDNRPLRFEEFAEFKFPKIYISATPGDYELDLTHGEIVTQYIRPTGLLDPIIEIHSRDNQIEDIYDHLKEQIAKKERTLILTTTKKNAEELSLFLQEKKIKSAYIHDRFKIFERNEILKGLRMGKFDVVVGINLLKEGIDLPEVSLICVLNADSTGLMRDTRSLIQIVGRAARNDHGKVIFYANEITSSMRECIEDNLFKRKIQSEYNEKHNIIPKTIVKPIAPPIQNGILSEDHSKYYGEKDLSQMKHNKKFIDQMVRKMTQLAKANKFEEAIEIRDYLIEIGIELDK
ncbi:excinuclease ABC subunit B [Metamycoplasma arthritidis]|uniref:UvrABC system protein B n=2 Tax=Metamycoplasmataceae TaxID=2895623 RepID=UVRB_META1|nr:excinuclease ABC subunit UvrB [Metamycoplasma arthritidis]B3PLX9.1 RecName: Full=UvrABC system protein B; Short=Protein UvrB; AltName: Full=Excinuclease ABC subunit B [Metamycoplasma arthritidis 158L3-1]Q9ZB21.1 RecName: Full=UvrABC system protein B; Short=Protein UvrB; AltName: Full=Excinuclease ABC subunit B [Mycoplasmopsis pulmonis]AAD00088.1 UvrB exinuclease subunit B [Mycoplasmopsis pulmonis]ACF07031.1 excinuclease ABC subunit B [Metamycoplasma arthritidis 158L3-1]VEU78559.1 excinuclea